MSRGILDTSVLIATDLTPIPGELAISVISLAELQFGVLVAKNEETRANRLTRLSAIQRRFDPLPVDDAVADSYARLAARVVRVHQSPSFLRAVYARPNGWHGARANGRKHALMPR